MVESKAISIGKDDEPAKEFVLKTFIKDLIKCYKKNEKNVRHYYPVSSYSLRLPPGAFLKHILPITIKRTDKIIEVRCENLETSYKISKKLEAMKLGEEKKLRELFKEEIESFKMLYFNPLKFLLLLTLEKEELPLITITGLPSLCKAIEFFKKLKETKVEYITYLEDLIRMAKKICMDFGKDEAEKDKNNLKEEKEETTNVVENWEKYIEFVIDISEHCEPITETINKIGEFYFNDEPSPKFSIYKIFVGMFIKFYYRGIAHKCSGIFKGKLGELNKSIIGYYVHACLDNQTKEQKNFSTGSPKDPGECKRFMENMQEVSNFFTLLLSLNMNELSVHYLYITSFFDKIGYSTAFNDIVECINTKFFVACEYINEKHGDIKQQIIRGMYYEYKKIFPPCFILDIEKYMDEVEYENSENKVTQLIKDFFKNKPKIEYIEDDINGVLDDVIKSACKRMRKEPNDEELEGIKHYIKENAKDLIEDLEAKEMQSVMDEFHENAILEKNISTCGLLTPDTNALFSIEGAAID